MEKNVYLFVCQNLADWEPALAVALLSDRYTIIPKRHSFPVVTFGLSDEPVRSFGGLTIVPDTDYTRVDAKDAAMVILPGSSIYEEHDPDVLFPLIRDCIRSHVPVAAICGGVLFLARHGFLDSVRHTGAGPGYLKKNAPDYRGEHLYVPEPCIADGGIITANPLGFIGFAEAIHTALDVFPPGFSEMLYGVVRKGYMDVGEY